MIFNALAFLYAAAGLIAAWLANNWLYPYQEVSDGSFVTSFAIGGAFLLIDVAYRAANFRDEGAMRFLWPSRGGHIFFVPCWLIGPILLFVGVNKYLAAG